MMKRLCLSRRAMLAGLGGAGIATLLGPTHMRALAASAEVDPRVADIVSRNVIIDMHSHVEIPLGKDPAEIPPALSIDLGSEMKRAGFSAVCQTYDLDGPNGPPQGHDYEFNLRALDFEDRLLVRNSMRRALNGKDLQRAHPQKQPVTIQCVEGAHFLEGRIERVEEEYKRGLRLLQLVHERDSTVAPLGDYYTGPEKNRGLTPFGSQVIRECNRLGLVVDLAHGTEATVRGAVKVSTQPIIISHGSLIRDTNDGDMRRRLIRKELARAVADGGGMIGMWWRLNTTTREYVESIRRMADVVGVDHVGIGSDTDLTASFILPYTNQIWPDESGGFFFAVAGEMLKQGFTPEETAKIGGGNFLRLFSTITDRRP